MLQISNNENDTREIAKRFVTERKGGEIICLHGDLGAGKTTFVKGLAQLLNIKMEITSPTFTLMNLYKVEPEITGIKYLVHIDTYRLKDEHELIEIGAEDYIGKHDTLTLIEWPEKIKTFLENKKVVNVYINHKQNNTREIIIE